MSPQHTLSPFFSLDSSVKLEPTEKTLSPVYLELFEKLSNEGVKAANCSEGFYVYRCYDCNHQWVARAFCKSRLCTRCSKILHASRVGKVIRKLQQKNGFTHVVFTLPNVLWSRVRTWKDIRELRQAAAKIVKDKIGKGGVVAVHTFSSETYQWSPHVHCLVYERRAFLWSSAKEDWRKFLRARYNYTGGSELNFYEKPFKKGRLIHRIRYVLRMPPVRFSTLVHFAFAKGKALYAYFGKGVHKEGEYKPFIPEKVICPLCGSNDVYRIAVFTRDIGFWFAEGWDSSKLMVEV